ncbi:MAG TPA: hypothetical protein PLO67_15465 [Saprospiraceae bacterium]|nr:hypothetical protein [Saprospiraceae bacterium]HPI08437.1 hypothetical protein [Saprospiraceae bacterium]
MKHNTILSTAILLLAALFISQTAQAQWSQSTTAIYPTTLTKKVGIGLNNPIYGLDVKGGIGLYGTSSYIGQLTDDGSGNLRISSSMSLNVNTPSKNLLLNAPGNFVGTTGRVGIGTNSPAEAQFVVKGHLNNTVAMFGQGTPGISLANSWSSVGFNSYVGTNGGSLVWKAMSSGYGAIMECNPATGWVYLVQNSNTSANAIPTHTHPFSVAANGNVLIGTTTDQGYKLAVNGNLLAKEIRVQSDWADYVFADDYHLRPLAEVETFIADNDHLPDIQPACEIQENGLDLAATTTKMMAKIEELTLYLIDQNKRLEKLEAENAALRARR